MIIIIPRSQTLCDAFKRNSVGEILFGYVCASFTEVMTDLYNYYNSKTRLYSPMISEQTYNVIVRHEAVRSQLDTDAYVHFMLDRFRADVVCGLS